MQILFFAQAVDPMAQGLTVLQGYWDTWKVTICSVTLFVVGRKICLVIDDVRDASKRKRDRDDRQEREDFKEWTRGMDDHTNGWDYTMTKRRAGCESGGV